MTNKTKWKKYMFEFLSIFIAVLSAFALSNWNENRRDDKAESKILIEILNGLEKDNLDVDENIGGHQVGIQSTQFWRKIFTNKEVSLDSLEQYYFVLTRDFVSIQNSSGYETLKSKGFELIKNDSLRANIISLYEYDYQILRKLEEEYDEFQFQDNYFHELNQFIAPNFQYNEEGDISTLELPIKTKASDRKIILSYLWKIKRNRNYVLRSYKRVKEKISILKKEIQIELKQ